MLSNEVRRLETENEKLRLAIKNLQVEHKEDHEKPKACDYCRFYVPHYIKLGEDYIKTYCGHCVHGRVKGRKPQDTCKYFELGNAEILR